MSAATRAKGMAAAIARSIIATASFGLVANLTVSGTYAAARRAGSSVQALGRYRARSTKAWPCRAALARVDHPLEAFASVHFATSSRVPLPASASMKPSISPPARSPTTPAAPGPARAPRPGIDASFVSDHEGDLDPLENVARLVRDGCRILLVGPPGGDKSAWAMEFARKAAHHVETLDGARFLARRRWSRRARRAASVRWCVPPSS